MSLDAITYIEQHLIAGKQKTPLVERSLTTEVNCQHLFACLASHFAMADGLNEARALRVVEIMNDFRTLQIHISTHLSRPQASPPNEDAYYEQGYVVLRQCNAEAQAVLATHFNPGDIGLESSSIGEGEQQKASLRRIVLDAASRRLQAHKIYLRVSAGIRWSMRRTSILRGDKPNAYNAAALRMADETLREELSTISDEYVLSDLRAADRRAGHWVDEDPSLDRIIAWVRSQR